MTDTTANPRSNWWTIALWVAQVLLALLFAFAGWMKLTSSVESLQPMMGWVTTMPEWLLRFIGMAEIAGAIGVILPAATRILPWLTPLAALGFALIQILAIALHATRGETAMTLPLNLVLLALALFVAWGRWRKAPIAPR